MEERDNVTCLKKRNSKVNTEYFDLFTFHCIKHGTRSSLFWREWHH